ncbi:MAG: gliding motility-associated C-terminal domain-containing protein, partial [Bacteroidota bacterium]
QVTVVAEVTAMAGNDIDFCNGDSGTIGGLSMVNQTYQWMPTTGLSDPDSAQTTVVLSNTGTTPLLQQYILQVTDTLFNCVDEDTVWVTVWPQMVPTLNLTMVSCAGGSDGTATVGMTGGMPPFQYSFNGGGFGPSNTITGLSAGPLTVSVLDSNNCLVMLNDTLSEPPALMAMDSVVNVTCNGAGNGEIWVTNVSGGTPPYAYNLNGGAFQSANNFTGLGPGAYTIVVQDSNGCPLNLQVNVTEPPALTGTPQITDVSCNGGSDGEVTIGNPGGGTPGYEYSMDQMNWQASPTFSNLAPGNDTIWMRDSLGCLLQFPVQVAEPAALDLSMSSTAATCGSSDGIAGVGVQGGTPGYTYLWDDPGAQTTATALNLAGGTYTVIVTDANGCMDTASVVVANIGVPSVAVNDVGMVNCYGAADGFAVATGSGGTPPYTFNWPGVGATTDSATGLGPGTYMVIITDDIGCTNSASVTITEPDSLLLTADFIDPTCFGFNDGSADVVVQGGTAPYDYVWSSDPPQTSASANNLPAGTYTVTVADANLCVDSISVTLSDPLQVTAAFVSNPLLPAQVVLEEASVSLSNQSTNAYFYDWDFGDGAGSTEVDPTHTYLDVGTFCIMLSASDSVGCTDMTQQCITVYREALTIPNTFTPNGDGRNDVFEILGVTQYPNNKLQVFNRWGNLVYEKDQYANDWDGRNWRTNEPLPDGAYFYIFMPNSEGEEDLMGDVVIFR